MRVILIAIASWVGLLSLLMVIADKHAVKYYYKHAWGRAVVRSVTPPAIYVELTKKASP